MHEPSDELTPQERDALEALRGEGPPMALEDRVVEALRERGALRPPTGGERAPSRERTVGRLLAAAATAVLCVALGASGALWLTSGGGAPGGEAPAGGPAGEPAVEPAGNTYALLLLSGPGEFEISQAEEAQRVQEYSGWAGQLAQAGRLVAGEKLADEARLLSEADASAAARLTPADRGDGILAGFFLIRAADDEEAVRIAADCPHLRYGGQVEVRRIEPT